MLPAACRLCLRIPTLLGSKAWAPTVGRSVALVPRDQRLPFPPAQSPPLPPRAPLLRRALPHQSVPRRQQHQQHRHHRLQRLPSAPPNQLFLSAPCLSRQLQPAPRLHRLPQRLPQSRSLTGMPRLCQLRRQLPSIKLRPTLPLFKCNNSLWEQPQSRLNRPQHPHPPLFQRGIRLGWMTSTPTSIINSGLCVS